MAILCANGDAIARTIAVDAVEGTSATVVVSAGEAGEHLRLAYGSHDGGADFFAWDHVTPSLAEVPAEGGTLIVTLPFAPLTAAESPCWRFVTAPPYNCLLDAIYGNGSRYFDTGLTNNSSDTVILSITCNEGKMEYDDKVYGLYGTRTLASSKNISAFFKADARGIADYTLDFNSTSGGEGDGISYRLHGYSPSSDGIVVVTSTNSASVRAFATNSVNGVEHLMARNDMQWSGDFECDNSACIFHLGGAAFDTAPEGCAFNYCRVLRGEETIADLIPVVAADGTTAIYDRVRNVFAQERGGGDECASGATNYVAAIGAMSSLGRSSAYRDISLTLKRSGDLAVDVSAGSVSGALVMAYGADDGGSDIAAWDSAFVLSPILAGEALAIVVPFPSGWGDTVNAMRFFATDRELRLAGDGNSYIDTCWTNGSDNVVEMVFQPLSLPDSARALYGCRSGSNSKNIVMFVDGAKFVLDFNDGKVSPYRTEVSTRNVAYRYRMLNSAEKRVAVWSQNGVCVGATTNDSAYSAVFTCAGSAYLFAANDMSGGSPAVLWSGQPINFYSLKVWTTDGTLRSDIRPCKIDGTAKVYDCVRNRYFENAGSEGFAFAVEGSNPFFGDTITITPYTRINPVGFTLIVR